MKPADLKRLDLPMAVRCVRNTFIEDFHAQVKLYDAEMMAFNKDVANRGENGDGTKIDACRRARPLDSRPASPPARPASPDPVRVRPAGHPRVRRAGAAGTPSEPLHGAGSDGGLPGRGDIGCRLGPSLVVGRARSFPDQERLSSRFAQNSCGIPPLEL
jgi:hypothetical protein